MALKTSVAVLLSLNLLFFATLSSSSALPPAAPTPQPSSCPMNTLKLGVCADLLHGSASTVVGSSPKPCCSLIDGLVDLEVAVCLCTAIKAGILGIIRDVPASMSLIINDCGKRVPSGFQCP